MKKTICILITIILLIFLISQGVFAYYFIREKINEEKRKQDAIQKIENDKLKLQQEYERKRKEIEEITSKYSN